MGPKTVSLAYGSRRFRRLPRAFPRGAGIALTVSILAPALAQAPPPPPLPSPLVELQQVRRVQIDVSVIDPRRDAWSSVPGFERDDFLLRVDGRPLPPEVAARTEFDAICSDAVTGPSEPRDRLAPDRPTLVILADLNFLDSRMRSGLTQALERLATIAETRPLRVKILAYSRRLLPMTANFTSDPAEIRRAAAELSAVVAPGPPLEGIKAPPVRESPDEPIDTQALYDVTSGDSPPSSETDPTEAFTILIPTDTGFRTAEITSARNPTTELASRDIDPRPSLAAIEAVLLAHASLKGRKALVLFSSPWFDLHEDLFLSYAYEPRRAAQGGFSIWTVDARGLGVPSAPGGGSRLLEFLATSTGGAPIRAAGSLGIVFDRVLSTLSCYYLFSVPLAAPNRGEERYSIDVRLDTAKHPEYWNYRVRTVSSVTIGSRQEVRKHRRLGALMDPSGFTIPDVRLSISYPAKNEALIAPIQVAALLADLTFVRDSERGDLVARFGWEGIVLDDAGNPVCTLGDALERTIRAETPPSRFPPTYVLLQASCALPGPGTYDARVLVEDLITGDVGAAEVQISLPTPATDMAGISALRLTRSTGRDFLLEVERAKSRDVPRDVERRSVVPLLEQESVHPGDRVVLRFVACGMAGTPRTILFRPADRAEGRAAPESVYQILPTPRGEIRSEATTCREYEAAAPENSLAPGTYGIAIIDPSVPASTRQDIDQILNNGQFMRKVEFRVITPAPGGPQPGEPV